MIRFLVRRVAYAVPVLLGVALITLFLFHVAGGDPVAIKLGKNPDPAEVEALRRELGLQGGFLRQYVEFLRQVVTFDYGRSWADDTPVREIFWRGLGPTLSVSVPAFALGRTQELVYDLHELWREGEIPEIPIFIDSPLALDATSVFKLHANVFDRTEWLVQETHDPLAFPLVRFTRSVDESKQLNARHGPVVIIAASGMAESGRILHHLRHGASDPRNTILLVGFTSEHTLGRRIAERRGGQIAAP